ncbi:MAG: flippase [Pseudomonadota bacterium]
MTSRMSDNRPHTAKKLIQGRLLSRNILFNLFGFCSPLLFAVFAIPFLIKGMGTDRFGVLTLAWVLIGYLGLLDFGISRALTKLVAEKLGENKVEDIPALIWTACSLMFFAGILLTLIITPIVPFVVKEMLNIPFALHEETISAFYCLAAVMPVVLISIGFKGILEAYQCFALINAVRIPLGIFTFLAPLLVLPFSRSLFYIVGILILGRIATSFIQLFFCLHVVPSLKNGIMFKVNMVGPLIRFGSWMTVSNVISPLMLHMERFFLGTLVSVTTVAYYSTPHEVVTKLLLVTLAFTGVLFPAFSTSSVQDPKHLELLFRRGVKYVFLASYPLVVVIILFAKDGLALWLGNEFAQSSAPVMQWQAGGVLFLCVGFLPYTLIQGAGRPKWTAWLHIIELPIYYSILWWQVNLFGIIGAAVVWTVRIIVETAILFCMAQRIVRTDFAAARRGLVLLTPALLILYGATLPWCITTRILFCLAFLTVFSLAAWFAVLNIEERTICKEHFKTFFRIGSI